MSKEVGFLQSELEVVLNRLNPDVFDSFVYSVLAEAPEPPQPDENGNCDYQDIVDYEIMCDIDNKESALFVMFLDYAGLSEYPSADLLDNGIIDDIRRRAGYYIGKIVKRNRELTSRYVDYICKEARKKMGNEQKSEEIYISDKRRMRPIIGEYFNYNKSIGEIDEELLRLGGVLGLGN